MANGLTLPKAHNAFAEALHKSIESIVTMIAPGTVTAQQFASCAIVAANECRDKSAEVNSLVLATAHAAQMGLVPGRAQRLAYFIPRKLNKGKPNERTLWQLTISYQGFITLATRNSFLKWVYADLVLQGEVFFIGVKESRPVIEHNVPPNRSLKAGEVRERLIGAYCLYETVSGGVAHAYMSRQEIDAIAAKGSPLWKGDNYPAMCRKTPIRRAANFWNLSPEMGLAVRLEDQLELGEAQETGTVIDVASGPSDVDLDDLEE